MRSNGQIIALAIILALLTACGGGSSGDGDKPLFPTTPIQKSAVINGTLSSSDFPLPDGTYADLYTVTVDSPTLLNIRMESTAFDAFLLLFDGAALALADLDQWEDHLLAFGDDIDDLSTDAGITHYLLPGTYVIVANHFEPGVFGPYTLKTGTAQLAVSGQYLQYRAYPNSSFDHLLGWMQFRDDANNTIRASDMLYARIFDPEGTGLIPASQLEFRTASFVLATWNPIFSQFDQIVPFGYSGYAFDFSNYSSLPEGVYTFTAMPAVGEPLFSQALIPVLPPLDPVPVVDAGTMSFEWNEDGGLQLSWTEPENPSDDYRMIFTLADTGTIIFHGVVREANQVILQPALVQQISESAEIALLTTVHWVIETRNFSGGVNYGRGFSAPVPISW